MAMISTCSVCGHQQPATSSYCSQCGSPMAGLGTGLLSPNSVLQGRYIIVKKVGQGGMGAVYQAVDQRIAGRLWAIKEMSMSLLAAPADRAQAIQAFQREASMLARLDHANLPKVADFFQEGGRHYLVMDFIEGETLRRMLDRQGRHPFPEALVIEWARQLCDVLGYLHSQNPPVIFRDLKPDNIMVTAARKVKLIDFGIARHFKPGQVQDTQRFGTKGYASPEQHGKGQTDARSDVYSLGVVLHELLTGHDPATTPFNLPAARQLNPVVSPHVDAALQKATRTRPDGRFQTAAEMSQALSSAITPPPLPHAQTVVQPPRRVPVWAVPMGIIVGFVVILGLGIVITKAIISGTRPTPTAPITAMASTETPTKALATTEAPTPTMIPVPTPMVTPVPTPTVTPVPTPIPTAPGGLVAYTAGPDGAWQIFVANPVTGEIWLLPGQLPNSGVPAWLPGGGRLAFRSNNSGTWQIYTINIDDTGLQQLTYGGSDNKEAVWSPDGTQIAFVSERDGNKEIYSMASDGGNQRRLTVNSGWDDDPNWSPDGGWLVFESKREGRTDVYKMRADGSNLVRLTRDGDLNSTPAWSPDGNLIAFEHKRGSTFHVWIMNTDGNNQWQLTSDGKMNLRPAWSPDGREIAYTSDRGGVEAIWVIPLDRSSAPHRLSLGEGFDAAWSRR